MNTKSEHDRQEKGDANYQIEGKNPVIEALRAGRPIDKIWLCKPKGSKRDVAFSRIEQLAQQARIPVLDVPKVALDRMAVTHNHQGAIAQAAPLAYADLDRLLETINKSGQVPFLLMLDEIKDAYNLGAILRIADAAGVQGVIVPKHRSTGLDAAVAKASAGAMEHVPVCRETNLVQTVERLKKDGIWVAGAEAGSKKNYFEADFKGPLLIVIGSEGRGIRPGLCDKCDFLVSIPLSGAINSLNAAVAAGIIIFEAKRQRLA